MNNETRHPALQGAAGLDADGLSKWLQGAAKVKFTDYKKRYFTKEELQEFEHESSANGREMNKLNSILKTVKELVTKGNQGDVVITIPETQGTKLLDAFRRQNDDFIELGYEMEPIEVFGIPYQATNTMEFFTLTGEHIPERSRDLLYKERNDFFGLFDSGAALSIDAGIMRERAANG